MAEYVKPVEFSATCWTEAIKMVGRISDGDGFAVAVILINSHNWS